MTTRTPKQSALIGLLLIATLCLVDQHSSAQEIPDHGDFVLDLGKARGAEAEVRSQLVASDLQAIVDDLNAEINLQEPVKITFWSAPADQEPAMYDLDYNQIMISYRFVVELSELFGGRFDGWYPNVVQIVLHEVAHALIDVNRIEPPASGQSELVADQLAFFILSEFYEADEDLLRVAEHFRARPNRQLNIESDHLPDDERAAAYVCWIEGKTQWLDDQSPEADSTGCVEVFENLLDDWDERLASSWKEPIGYELESELEYD